jgi:hypothetical protein
MGIKGGGDMLTKEHIEARKLRLVELALTMTPQNEALADRLEQITLCDMALAHLKASKQEPVAFYTHDFKGKDHGNLCMWGKDIPERIKFKESSGHQWMPLYAAPIPAKSPEPIGWIQSNHLDHLKNLKEGAFMCRIAGYQIQSDFKPIYAKSPEEK